MRLISAFFATFMLAVMVAAQAQTEKRVYFDQSWKPISSFDNYEGGSVVVPHADYEYYRVVYLNSDGIPIGQISTYFADGSLQWRGQFTSTNIECTTCEECGCVGLCTWYYRNGKKQAEIQYQDGKEVGDSKYWDQDGNEISKEARLASEISIKTIIEAKIISGTYHPIEGVWSASQQIHKRGIDKRVAPVFSQPLSARYGIVDHNGQRSVFLIDRGFSGLRISEINQSGEFLGTISNERGEKSFEGSGKLIDEQNVRIVMEGSNEAKQKLQADEAFFEIRMKKEYPSQYDIENILAKARREAPKSGTGFALSSNGLIATNYHVIENAKTIKVRGIKGDFSVAYSAKTIKTDHLADLAVIQITDPSFIELGKVPYSLVTSNTDVGEEVFALGYPLTNTMGEEVKLTTGVVSSNSGFQGNPNQYQVSVPIQPGNSGGPLFDKTGKVVGIINSKHSGTDNVSYAVKARNLIGLFYMIPDATLSDSNLLSGKTLPEKVRIAKNFVYIIEVNK